MPTPLEALMTLLNGPGEANAPLETYSALQTARSNQTNRLARQRALGPAAGYAADPQTLLDETNANLRADAANPTAEVLRQAPENALMTLLGIQTQGQNELAKEAMTRTSQEKIASQAANTAAATMEREKAKEANALELQRLKDAGKSQIDVTPDTRQTATGRAFVDISKYPVANRADAINAAHAAGTHIVSANEADALQNIETARQNMDAIEKNLSPHLPTSAMGRVAQGPLNWLSATLQTDPELASVGTYRTAAIQAMRALAGAKGLRINRAEIEAAMQNDIPQYSDTLDVAKRKFSKVREMLSNQEGGILGGEPGGGSSDATDYSNPNWGK